MTEATAIEPASARFENVAHYGCVATVLSLPFPRFPVGQLHGMPVLATDVAFVATLIAFALAILTNPKRLRWTPLMGALVVYGLGIAASVPFSIDPRRSAMKLVIEGYLLCLAWLVFELANTSERRERLARAFIAGGIVTSVACAIGAAAFYFGFRDRETNVVLSVYGSLPPGNYPRVMGFFVNMNAMCSYMVIPHQLLLMNLEEPWLRGVRGRIAVALSIVSTLFTFSVGFGGIALGTGLAIASRMRHGAFRIVGRAMLAGSGLVALVLAAATVVPTVRGDSHSVRSTIWSQSWQTFLRHPVFGQGVGTDPADVSWRNPSGALERLREAHNIWLSVAAQEGIVGVVAFAILNAFLVREWWRAEHDLSRSAGSRRMVRALGLSFLFALHWGGIGSALEDSRHVWVLIGFFAAACFAEEPSRRATDELVAS